MTSRKRTGEPSRFWDGFRNRSRDSSAAENFPLRLSRPPPTIYWKTQATCNRASSHAILGEIVFEAEDGVIYAMTVEAVISAATPKYVKDVQAELAEESQLLCHQCGEPMFVNENGVTHHLDSDGRIDYDADAEHTPYSSEEQDR
jgi:hypothetical protein